MLCVDGKGYREYEVAGIVGLCIALEVAKEGERMDSGGGSDDVDVAALKVGILEAIGLRGEYVKGEVLEDCVGESNGGELLGGSEGTLRIFVYH